MPLGGFQFGCPTALFGLDAVVLAGAGSLQEVASGVEPTAKAGFDGKGFGVNLAEDDGFLPEAFHRALERTA